MEKILVTQALNELKTLDNRINRAIQEAKFVAAAKTCEKKVNPSKTKEDFVADAKSSFDSINALIARREAIKSAVVQSNAITEVEVCGQKFSIAKVIDMKNSIQYQKDWVYSMKRQFESSTAEMNRKNADLENKIDDLVKTSYGKDSKTTIKAEEYDAIALPMREHNEYSLVDPLEIEKLIKGKIDFIEQFESTVDQVLQISNCTTFIEI